MKLVKILVAVFAVFLFFVWGISSYLGVDDLKKCGEQPSAEPACGAAGAIVAVSGGDTYARAAEAIKLYKNGWAEKLIFSGAAADKSGPSNAEVMKQQAIDAGIDSNVIFTDSVSETTIQNATETSNIFQKHNIKNAILVTSAYHARRAMLEFDKRTLGVTVRSHPVANDKQWDAWWWLTPTGWALAIPETVRSLILSTGGVDSR